MGANSVVNGSVTTRSAGYVVLGAGAQVSGSITAGGTTSADYVTTGAGSVVGGNISTAGSYITLGAGTQVAGNISTKISYIALGASSVVRGQIAMNDPTPSYINMGAQSRVYAVCCNGRDASCVTDGSGITPGPLVCGTPTSGSVSASFDCLEPSTNSPWVATARKPLHTKLAGIDFTLDVTALKTDGTLETKYVASGGATKNVKLELVDGAGATACLSRAAIVEAVPQTLSFTAADGGRKSTANVKVNKAYANLRCRVTDTTQPPNVVSCSSDSFSVRPQSFTVSSSNANADGTGTSTTASPAIKAGASFSLSADAATVGYNGTPVLDSSRVVAHTGAIQVGALAGTFSAATATTGNGATGAGFTYGEVGYFQLTAGGVVDTSFTGVDSVAGDCIVGSSSTNASGGKYGCNIGSATSPYFGRFIPDHFLVVPGTVINRNAAACAVVSTFTYAGEEMQFSAFKLIATNGFATPTTTQNYTGAFARFDDSVIGNFGFAAVDLADSIAPFTTSAFVTGSGAGQFNLVSSLGSWASGIGTFSANVRLGRAAALMGPFESFRVGIEPVDADAVSVLPSAQNLDISAPADAINDKVLLGSTKVRFGRIRLQNAYGSELLALSIPIAVQYFDAATGSFKTNLDDSCTPLVAPVARTLTGTATPDGLANLYFYPVTGNNQLRSADTVPTVTNAVGSNVSAVVSGVASLRFSKPSKQGWLDIILASPSYLLYDWGKCLGQSGAAGLPSDLPCARATFGIYKSPLIYLRENY